MAQEGYRPSFSLAGAVDLEALKHKTEAAVGEEGGAPASGGYVIDVNEANFEATFNSSNTFPVLLLVWIHDDERFFDIASRLAQIVNKFEGKIQLARIDGNENPQIVQALRVQGIPALYGLVAGRPIPMMQGMPSDNELKQLEESLLPQVIAMAEQSGVTGVAPFIGETTQETSESENAEPAIPAGHEKAHELAVSGEYAQAAAEYAKLVERDPHDVIAAREKAKCLLLARNGNSDVRVVRAAAAENPDDVSAQLDVADIDMIGGQIQDAFSRLLDFIPGHREESDAVRERLVEYFAIPDASDPRLRAARQKLMTLLY